MKNLQKLLLTFLIAATALLLYFAFNQQSAAQILVTITGSVLALSMFVDMIKTIRSGSYGVDLLAITAIAATLLVGEYWAALIIIVMLVGGESLEDYAANVAHRELTSLLQKSPQVAHLRQGETGDFKDVPINEVPIGSTILVRPLEVVPIDGILASPAATLDESSITGESKPYELNEGDEVVSGSINTNKAIDVKTTTDARDSQLQKIVNLVKEAENTPARFVRLADRYAVPFTLAAYVIAAIAYFISGDPKRIAEVLVVASPCPLILAAPIAFVSGMSRSSKSGVLIKNGTVIEKLAKAKSVFFDKTGTITSGKILVDKILPENGLSEQAFLEKIYSVQKASNHILAKAVSTYAETKGISRVIPEVLTEVPGMGVEADVNGHHIKIGRKVFAHAPENISYETAFYVSEDEKYIGAVAFTDSVRENAGQIMQNLHSLGVQKITMLTGDNAETAQKIASQVGIDNIYAQLLPDEKLNHIKNESLKPTVMVGDGVNDAPALALADVGIAMGIGENTVASETADLVLLKNDLAAVPTSIKISRDTLKIAKQAVIIGIVICLALMLIALTGFIPATIGALFQEVVDTVSIFYALRALKG